MAIGSRRKRGDDEYIFVDGKVMRSDEVVRIDLETQVPGQEADQSIPGQKEAQAERDARNQEARHFARSRAALRAMNQDDAFGLRSENTMVPGGAEAMQQGQVPGQAEAQRQGPRQGPQGQGPEGQKPQGPQHGPGYGAETKSDVKLMFEDSHIMRRKCIIAGVVLVAVILFSLCVSHGYYFTFYSPAHVVHCYAEWFRLRFIQFTDPTSYAAARMDVLGSVDNYLDVVSQMFQVFKYATCGVLLSVAGALYQNTFRNPIAAPSMLGVSNGVSLALLLMVLIYGTTARSHVNMYYLFTYIGGGLVLVLVLLGGKWISGKGQFNVVNMLLMGTIISQMSSVIMTYVQNYVFTEDQWYEYYLLQTATDVNSIWSGISIAICTIIAFVPVIIFRFQLNLVSFSDAETKLLGINPDYLRAMALICGSLMVLTAQVNTGQVSMVSLIVPFIARAVFGSEFRKQLVGTCLIGASLLLFCGDLTSLIYIDNVPLDLGSIVTIVTLPLFVWMLAIQQRAWE